MLNGVLQLHQEQLPSAQERYAEEIKRILGVINTHLAATGRPFLVGDKVSFADLMFVPWDRIRAIALMSPGFEASIEEQFPSFHGWQERLLEMESVKKATEFTMSAAAAAPGAEKDIEETLPK